MLMVLFQARDRIHNNGYHLADLKRIPRRILFMLCFSIFLAAFGAEGVSVSMHKRQFISFAVVATLSFALGRCLICRELHLCGQSGGCSSRLQSKHATSRETSFAAPHAETTPAANRC
jgi:hypothetical protein